MIMIMTLDDEDGGQREAVSAAKFLIRLLGAISVVDLIYIYFLSLFLLYAVRAHYALNKTTTDFLHFLPRNLVNKMWMGPTRLFNIRELIPLYWQ